MLVFSGGQIGADLGALAGALAAGTVETRIRTYQGFLPIGRTALPSKHVIEWLAVDGTTEGERLHQRICANVNYCDAALIFVHAPLSQTRGTLLTINECIRRDKPFALINVAQHHPDCIAANALIALDAHYGLQRLLVAGQRSCNEGQVAAIMRAALELTRMDRAQARSIITHGNA